MVRPALTNALDSEVGCSMVGLAPGLDHHSWPLPGAQDRLLHCSQKKCLQKVNSNYHCILGMPAKCQLVDKSNCRRRCGQIIKHDKHVNDCAQELRIVGTTVHKICTNNWAQTQFGFSIDHDHVPKRVIARTNIQMFCPRLFERFDHYPP